MGERTFWEEHCRWHHSKDSWTYGAIVSTIRLHHLLLQRLVLLEKWGDSLGLSSVSLPPTFWWAWHVCKHGNLTRLKQTLNFSAHMYLDWKLYRIDMNLDHKLKVQRTLRWTWSCRLYASKCSDSGTINDSKTTTLADCTRITSTSLSIRICFAISQVSPTTHHHLQRTQRTHITTPSRLSHGTTHTVCSEDVPQGEAAHLPCMTKVTPFIDDLLHIESYCWWFRYSAKHLGCIKPIVNNGINYVSTVAPARKINIIPKLPTCSSKNITAFFDWQTVAVSQKSPSQKGTVVGSPSSRGGPSSPPWPLMCVQRRTWKSEGPITPRS